jgi:hypothetical protein
MNKFLILHKIFILLIKRARERKVYPIDAILSQYGLKSPLVSILGYLMFITFKIFIWGAACENIVWFGVEKMPNVMLSVIGTFASLIFVDLYMKRFFYANLYYILSILPFSIFNKLLLKYSLEILGYRLIFILLDLIILVIFLGFYFPFTHMHTLAIYIICVFFTHYLTFGSYSLLFNQSVKALNLSSKTVTTLNNYFLNTLVLVAICCFGGYDFFSRSLNLSVYFLFKICFVFITTNLILSILIDIFFDKNITTNDNTLS